MLKRVTKISSDSIKEEIDINIIQYGILEYCKKCKKLGRNCKGQYNAPGLKKFYCADREL